MQAINSEMWNAAMLAQSRADNEQGVYTTWLWAQLAHGQWQIRDPQCDMQLAQGVVAIAGHPVQGLSLHMSLCLQQHLQLHMHQHYAHGQDSLPLVDVKWQGVCMCLPACLPVRPSVRLSTCTYSCPYVGPSVYLPVCLYVPAVCLTACLSEIGTCYWLLSHAAVQQHVFVDTDTVVWMASL